MTKLDRPAPIETPVWLELDGRPSGTWLCTPLLLDALTCGWLNGEGLISDRGELLELEIDPDLRWVKARTARQRLAPRGTLAAGPGDDSFSLERIPEEAPRSVPDLKQLIASGELRTSFGEMYERCPLRASGGGVHSGAILVGGEVLFIAEDVGRHNVTDKLIGRAMLEGVPLRDALILISARISAAMAVKAWRGGVGGIATLSVPTSLARDIATRAGLWLVGRSLKGSAYIYEPTGEASS